MRSAGAVLDVDLETGIPLTRFLRLLPENEIELAADEIPNDDSRHKLFDGTLVVKKSRNIRLGGYTLRFAPPPPPLPQPVSSPEARAAVDAFCKHLNELPVQAVEMLEVSNTGIKFRRRAGRIKSSAFCADLGLLDTRATSENVAAVFRRGDLRTHLEHMYDAVQARNLSEAKFRANMISASVYQEAS